MDNIGHFFGNFNLTEVLVYRGLPIMMEEKGEIEPDCYFLTLCIPMVFEEITAKAYYTLGKTKPISQVYKTPMEFGCYKRENGFYFHAYGRVQITKFNNVLFLNGEKIEKILK